MNHIMKEEKNSYHVTNYFVKKLSYDYILPSFSEITLVLWNDKPS